QKPACVKSSSLILLFLSVCLSVCLCVSLIVFSPNPSVIPRSICLSLSLCISLAPRSSEASGGSSLLNLDFFGPVDESPSSSTTSIPGVDPELYELTQAKLEVSGGSSRVADAFARLMSTVEKTNTSTRSETPPHYCSPNTRGLQQILLYLHCSYSSVN
uniref:Uncharacterized protein n=1 Tax=Astyanax mexicanus TaxID=7994 RepID=A0A8B9H0C5_ASTMX